MEATDAVQWTSKWIQNVRSLLRKECHDEYTINVQDITDSMYKERYKEYKTYVKYSVMNAIMNT